LGYSGGAGDLYVAYHGFIGLYTSNISYAASYFDIEPEDLQFSMSLTYGTFLATILIESRLFKYFLLAIT
jgi:hypothetical protein